MQRQVQASYIFRLIDKDQSGWTAFCEALPSSKIQKLVLSDIGIGPLGLTTLAKFTPGSAALNEITLDSTGDVKQPKAYTISGLQGGAEPSLDLSSLNFGPADVSFLATLFTSFRLFTPALSEVNLSMNKCFGDKEGYDESYNNIRVHDVDKDQTGWTAFCEAIKHNKLMKTLILSDIGIGPVGLTTLAKFIPDSTALTAVNVMKLSLIHI